jgi:hypothetical protein
MTHNASATPPRFRESTQRSGRSRRASLSGLPTKLLRSLSIVGPVEDDVTLACLIGLSNGRGAGGNLLHGSGGLEEGNRICSAAAQIEYLPRGTLRSA